MGGSSGKRTAPRTKLAWLARRPDTSFAVRAQEARLIDRLRGYSGGPLFVCAPDVLSAQALSAVGLVALVDHGESSEPGERWSISLLGDVETNWESSAHVKCPSCSWWQSADITAQGELDRNLAIHILAKHGGGPS